MFRDFRDQKKISEKNYHEGFRSCSIIFIDDQLKLEKCL